MTEVADLRIKVDTTGVPQATSELRNLASAGGKAERATGSLMGTLGKFASVAAIAGAAMLGFNKLLNTQRQFDIINAGLITATGSAEDAGLAFEALQEFATKTPFSLQQVSESFVKLVNMGLTPSEKALTSYGNTSSALGKDLNMMIEAVADAATGEFERLKEFGIKANKQGDQIKLTFRGVSETVGNSAGEIEDYLIRLGETNFGDAMSNRMSTLDGALSNLGDSWDQLFLKFADSGIGDRIADGVRGAIDILDELGDWLASGELEGSLDAISAKFGPWADDAVEAVDIIQNAMEDFSSWVTSTYPEDMEILSDAWNDFPENIRAIIQLATVHVAWFVERVRIGMEAVEGYLGAIEDGWGGNTLASVYAQTEAAAERNNANLDDTVSLILEQMQATKDSAIAARAAALAKAADAKKDRDARKAASAGKDRLGDFGVDRPDKKTEEGKEDKSGAKAAKKLQQDYQNLVEALRTEEEALQASYTARRGIIERSTAAESAARADMMGRLEKWRSDEEGQISESKNRELKQIQDSLMTEEQAIMESYERRRKIVLDSMPPGEAQTKLLEKLQREKDLKIAFEEQARLEKYERVMQASMTEAELMQMALNRELDAQKLAYEQDTINYEEYLKNKKAIQDRYAQAAMDAVTNENLRQLHQYTATVGVLGDMFAQFAQGSGKNAERMFKISKALNLAQAVMATAAGIMEAQKEGNMYMRIAEQVRIAAIGAMQIAAIQSQKFSGAYDDGGRIPAGQFGIVGEKGMEIVSGPANVTSRRETARALKGGGDGGVGGGAISVSISVAIDNRGNVQSSSQVEGGSSEAQNAKALGALIDERVRGVLLKEQRQGGLLTNRAA